MAVTFTETDIEFYKAALARYAAKENCLIEKWSKRTMDVKYCVSEYKKIQYLSEIDRRSLDLLERIQGIYSEFLADIKTPCDSFITDFEWKKVGR